jgi:RNA polymerase sigma factor (sigma-70 family)
MASNPFHTVLCAIRRISAPAEARGEEDRQLLEAFLRQRDEEAFGVLLRRYGPLVLGVCRRLLRDPHDSEDAFQATFLVLLRKASSLRNRDLLAGWLYGVAYRTALKARGNRARRRTREQPLPEEPAVVEEDIPVETALRAVLDEELRRLPAKYRLPIILCYLQGATYVEAGRRLGWPAGTVSGRLARARDLLRARLERRGVTLSAATVGAVLAQEAAAVPAPLALATLRAALSLTAAAGAGVSASVATLTEGVLHAMFLTKVKIAVVVLLAAGGVGAGTWGLTYPRLAAEPPVRPAQAAPPPAAKPGPEAPPIIPGPDEETIKLWKLDDTKVKAILEASTASDKLKGLLRDRYAAARDEAFGRSQQYLAGRGPTAELYAAALRLLDAEKELSGKKADQVAALERHLRRMKEIEQFIQAQFDAGRASLADALEAKSFRLQAEIWLERVKDK